MNLVFFSFGMTEHYFVFVEIPYYVNATKMLWNLTSGKAVLDAMKVYPNEQVAYYITYKLLLQLTITVTN